MKETLSADLIMEDLGTRVIGRKVLYYPSVTSTNETAKKEAGQETEEGTVVIADEQTAGRGRLKRSWLTPEGNIAMSVVLYPDKALLPSLIMMASLAVVHSLESVTGLKPQIKWPNDVLIGGRKVCGILIETDVRTDRVNYAVIGIGINVRLNPEEYPEISASAAGLSSETGTEVSRLSIVRKLLADMDDSYSTLSPGGQVYSEWRSRLVTLGKKVRVTGNDRVYEGVAESVDTDGSLLLREAGGNLNRIVAGDVTLRE